MSVSPTHPSSRAGMIWRGALVGVASLAMVLGLIPAAAHAAEPAASVPAEPLTASSSVGLSIPEVAALAVDAAAAVETAVKPASLAGFNPANLIDDAVFYDGNAMTAAQIQTFLDQRIGNCSNGRCLNVSQASISSRAALVSQATGNVVCNAIAGGTMRVSELIYRVQRACGISAKVILVTLEKEQGLTTSRAPSDWNLRAAMGAYCPDSAPCDPAFAGVGPQIVAGVTQLKMYRAGAFARQPGTHFIQYHPNQSCGGTNVNVQNYATAALYNYTPYQPNPASLAAVSGTGDGCSSYGNRNFYRFFTSWFGSVRSNRSAELVKDGPHVYVTSGTTRYHIVPTTLAEYQRVFGAPRAVSSDYVSSLTDGGRAALFIRNASTGEVALLQDGQRHWFNSCTLVAAWGGQCNTETSFTSGDFQGIPRGGDMTAFARRAAGAQVHQIVGNVLHPVYDDATVNLLNGGRAPYAAVLDASVAARYTTGYVRFAPARFVDSGGKIYLPTSDGRLYYLPHWGLAAEMGMPSSPYKVNVPSSAFAGYSPEATLTSFARCGDGIFYAAGGALHPVSATAATGFTVHQLDSATCGSLQRRTSAPLQQVFVQRANTFDVYLAVAGTYRHITSPRTLERLGGGSRPTILTLSSVPLTFLRPGAPLASEIQLVAPGDFVDITSPTRTYLPTADGRVIYLTDWAIAADVGLERRVGLRTTDAALAPYRVDGQLSHWISCRGTTYFAAKGTLYPTSGQASSRFAVSRLDDAICARLSVSTAPALGTVFIQEDGSNNVYIAREGVFRHVTSPVLLAQLGGGTRPTVLAVTPGTLQRVAVGAPLTN